MKVKPSVSMTDSKSKILMAASELFAENGAGGLSVRAISGRAGLSTIGIYNHFNGKQGISSMRCTLKAFSWSCQQLMFWMKI